MSDLSKLQKEAFSITDRQTSVEAIHSGPKIHRVVLTGGPCGGKTTGCASLVDFFENLGWKVYVVNETATHLFKGGVRFPDLNTEQQFSFQKGILETMICVEDIYVRLASLETKFKNILILCDRGAMDGSAYIPRSEWLRLLESGNWNEVDIRDGRYDQVIHLVTAADGAESFYSLDNNTTRLETVDEAKAVDKKSMEAWLGHPYLDVLDNSTSFHEKMNRLARLVCKRVGIFHEDGVGKNTVKRKYLVKGDTTIPIKHAVFDVTHIFLLSEDGTQSRLRSRGKEGVYSYTLTTRHPVKQGERRIETRRAITGREYDALQHIGDVTRVTVSKSRVAFIYQDKYFQMDIFKSPHPGLVLLETYDRGDTDGISNDKIPNFLNVEKDVTEDPAYSLFNLAKKID